MDLRSRQRSMVVSVGLFGVHRFLERDSLFASVRQVGHMARYRRQITDFDRCIRLLAARPNAIHPVLHVMHAGLLIDSG
jgi:hypothetical protein